MKSVRPQCNLIVYNHGATIPTIISACSSPKVEEQDGSFDAELADISSHIVLVLLEDQFLTIEANVPCRLNHVIHHVPAWSSSLTRVLSVSYQVRMSCVVLFQLFLHPIQLIETIQRMHNQGFVHGRSAQVCRSLGYFLLFLCSFSRILTRLNI